jgi:hypothetical protein
MRESLKRKRDGWLGVRIWAGESQKKGPDQENKISRALAVARVAPISY